MKSTKKRERGLGDNLYGIPLDDILTPEQLEHMKKTSAAQVRERRRRKSEERKNKFRIPEIRLTRNAWYIVAVVAVFLILVMIFKNPIVSGIAPKLYVSEAMENTFKRIGKESDDALKGIFGFNIADKKELTVTARGGVSDDSYGGIAGLSMNSQIGYSKKDKNLSGNWHYFLDGQEFASASMYLNDEEIGFNMPQLFGEYWVASAPDFGKKWNDSGFRRAIYESKMSESTDLSFSNLFRDRNLLSEDGMKWASKLLKKLVSSSNAEYLGKADISVDGKVKKGRSFKYAFPQAETENYLISLINLILNDADAAQNMSFPGSYDEILMEAEDFKGRLTDSINIDSLTASFTEYKGSIMCVSINAAYTENGVQTVLNFELSFENSKNIIDNMHFSLTSSGGKNYSAEVTTSGNHLAKGKVFTDATTLVISTDDSVFKLNSSVSLDYKNGQASGEIIKTDSNGTATVSYSGICSRKGGFTLELADVNLSRAGNAAGTIAGNLYIDIDSDMNIGKINAPNKKLILELNKTEAESYIQKLEESDGVRKFLDIVESISDGSR